MPPTQPVPAPLQDNFSTARQLNLLHKVNNAGAAGIQEATVITNPSANNQPKICVCEMAVSCTNTVCAGRWLGRD
jgi:hypothetical protein